MSASELISILQSTCRRKGLRHHAATRSTLWPAVPKDQQLMSDWLQEVQHGSHGCSHNRQPTRHHRLFRITRADILESVHDRGLTHTDWLKLSISSDRKVSQRNHSASRCALLTRGRFFFSRWFSLFCRRAAAFLSRCRSRRRYDAATSRHDTHLFAPCDDSILLPSRSPTDRRNDRMPSCRSTASSRNGPPPPPPPPVPSPRRRFKSATARRRASAARDLTGAMANKEACLPTAAAHAESLDPPSQTCICAICVGLYADTSRMALVKPGARAMLKLY